MQDRPATPGPAAQTDGDDRASFGFRDVPAAEKAGLVRQVFDSVSRRYDLMNDLMSLGVHRLWKDTLVDVLAPRAGESLLDLAGGTGDIAFRLHGRTQGKASIQICDINPSMLSVGRDRAVDRGLFAGLGWAAGDAEALPFADRRFDAVSIAFGLRNVTRIDRALAEAHRVLRPGGRFLCLEFSRVETPGLTPVYDAWSERMLPLLGGLVAGDRESYRYLHESIRRFPPQAELARRMSTAGFGAVKWRNMTGGVVALHTGWRI